MAGHDNMPAVREVRSGEWVSRIACVYGVADWKSEIWRLPDNEELRDRRDPYVLAPGDQLAMPIADARKDASATTQQHPFEIKLVNDVLRLRILTMKPGKHGEKGAPDAPQEYEPTKATTLDYVIHRASTHPVVTGSGPISGGKAEIQLPRDAIKVEIRYEDRVDDAHVLKRRVMCVLGCLRPISMKDEGDAGVGLRARGVQQRLLALGFAPGPLDGVVGSRTRGAVRTFQRLASSAPVKGQLGITGDIKESGVIDEKTVTALRQAYGA